MNNSDKMPLSLYRSKNLYDRHSLETDNLLCAANMKAFATIGMPAILGRWEQTMLLGLHNHTKANIIF